ncbi:MAG: DUF2147 domain-containing protein, partial [Planctomycetia bacterium]
MAPPPAEAIARPVPPAPPVSEVDKPLAVAPAEPNLPDLQPVAPGTVEPASASEPVKPAAPRMVEP